MDAGRNLTAEQWTTFANYYDRTVGLARRLAAALGRSALDSDFEDIFLRYLMKTIVTDRSGGTGALGGWLRWHMTTAARLCFELASKTPSAAGGDEPGAVEATPDRHHGHAGRSHEDDYDDAELVGLLLEREGPDAAEILRDFASGATMRQIGRERGVTGGAIHLRVKRWRRRIAARFPEVAAEYRPRIAEAA